jgi:choline dehydrogenase
LLQAPEDRATFRAMVNFTRTFFKTSPASSLVIEERMPGALVQTDDEIDAHVRRMVGTAMHPTSTCAMGVDEMAVVDASLRVRGLESLRVVDASVMPTIPGGNTNAPTIMIGEKASDLILGKRLPPEDV